VGRDLVLGSYPPHERQREYLEACGRPTQRRGDPRIVHARWGRGSGKTQAGILDILDLAGRCGPGWAAVWSEPTHRQLHTVFLRSWRTIVPREMYSIRESAPMSIRLANGFVLDLQSREYGRLESRGSNYCAHYADELASDKSREAWRSGALAVRVPPPDRPLLLTSLSTPIAGGWYQELLDSDDAIEVRASSLDNPYLPEGWADALASTLSPEYVRQEIYGDFVSFSGRVWQAWADEEWPTGNRWPYGYDAGRPYVLSCDLGIESAWQVWQTWGIEDGYPYSVHVCVAEWTPGKTSGKNVGAEATLARIDEAYGCPLGVVVGHDVHTRASTDALTPAVFLRRRWGSSVPIWAVTGRALSHQIGHLAVESACHNSLGERRLCVSAQLREHDAHARRGILRVLREDAWPERGEGLAKDGRLEHARDALRYYAVHTWPPNALRTARTTAR